LKFTKGDTIVSLDKLWFLQRRHATRYAALQPPKPSTPFHDLEEIAVKPTLAALNHHVVFNPEDFPFYALIPEEDRFNYVRAIVWADAQNYTGFDDFITRHMYFFNAPSDQSLSRSSIPPRLAGLPNGVGHMAVDRSVFHPLFESFREIEKKDWTDETLKQKIDSIVDQASPDTIKKMQSSPTWSDEFTPLVRKSWEKLVHEHIRWALMAWMPGPTGVKTMRILGREECLRRFDRAANSAPVTVMPIEVEPIQQDSTVSRKVVS
jgi:glutamyl-tRNA synthetase